MRRSGELPYESSKNVVMDDAKPTELDVKAKKTDLPAMLFCGGSSKQGGRTAPDETSSSRSIHLDDFDEDNEDESALPEPIENLVLPFTVDTRSEEERSRARNKKKRAGKRKHKHKADEAEEGEEESASVVHHSAPATAAAAYKTMTLEQIRLENFRLNHGITIDADDEIDLEDTSCESSDDDSCDSVDEVADEFSVKNSIVDDPDDDDEGDISNRASFDPLGDEFDQHTRDEFQRRERDRSRRKKRQKSSEKTSSGVASQRGRLNHCFLCSWGKRTDDEVNNEHMEKLWRIFHSNIGEVPMKYIALAMHGYYRTVIRTAATARGQKLPRWRSKHVFICITTHNKIPQVALVHDLSVLDTMQGFLERKIGVQPIGVTADDRPVRDMMKELRETIATKWRLYAMPLSRMNFHSDDRNIKLGSNQPNFRGVVLAKSTSRAGAPLTAASAAKKLK